MPTVLVVRPYATHLRARVFAALQGAGVDVRATDVIPRGATDDQVISLLRVRRPTALVLPFHAHLDVEGHSVNGLALAERIDAELPHLGHVRILMPASVVALPAARLRLEALAGRPGRSSLRDRILLVDDALLDSPAVVSRLVSHLARVA